MADGTVASRGGIFGLDSEVLFFILVFLFLFYNGFGYGRRY